MNHRKLLMNALLNSKYDFDFWMPDSGYFAMVDISRVNVEDKYYYSDK